MDIYRGLYFLREREELLGCLDGLSEDIMRYSMILDYIEESLSVSSGSCEIGLTVEESDIDTCVSYLVREASSNLGIYALHVLEIASWNFIWRIRVADYSNTYMIGISSNVLSVR